MEAKASKMSQRSSAQEPRMSKTTSKASISPSQMSERTRLNLANMNKDPLDALSRMTQRQMAERRSGLQDVDDEYLKNVVYAYAGRTRVEAAQKAEVRADMMPAGVPTKRGEPGPGQRAAAKTNQQEAGQNQQPTEAAAAAQEHVAQEKVLSNQPAAGAAVPPAQNRDATQAQNATPAAGAGAGATGTGAAAGATDPELYTTCPNCRATLYLVRNVGDPSPYGAQSGAQSQQGHQQQQQQPPQSPQQQQQPAPAAVPVQQ